MKEEKPNKYILMYKNYEVLSFSVRFKPKREVHLIEKLEHFDKAPYGFDSVNADIDSLLFIFLKTRCIASQRFDFLNIIKATHSVNDFDLSFKGHGLSLMNHYWYKKEGENLRYEDISFFLNKWDDSFAKAVLNRDYKALKTCDLNVPDIVTPGWSLKGWIYDDGPKLYKISRDKSSYDDALGEVLGSRLARRVFGDDEVLHYELKKVGDYYASVSPLMINIDEELIPLSNFLPDELYRLYLRKSHDKKYDELFYKKLKEINMPELYQFFIKLACLRSLCFISDLHFGNISVIKNNKTGKIRVAPIYDLAGSFATSERGKRIVSNVDKGTILVFFFLFANLDPNWDYSWYDSSRLDGFEDEIIETLSKSKFYTPEIIENIIFIYRYQKKTLDEIASKKV